MGSGGINRLFTDDMRCYYLSHADRNNAFFVHQHVVDMAHLKLIHSGVGYL